MVRQVKAVCGKWSDRVILLGKSEGVPNTLRTPSLHPPPGNRPAYSSFVYDKERHQTYLSVATNLSQRVRKPLKGQFHVPANHNDEG